jgi:hypothetical protein
VLIRSTISGRFSRETAQLKEREEPPEPSVEL